MHHVCLLVAIAACSKTECPPGAAPTSGQPERAGAVHRGTDPLTLVGPDLDVGDAMPGNLGLVDGSMAPVDLVATKGKVVVLSVVPSIDTRVCESQTHHVSDAIDQMPAGTEVFTISRDLPFAQTRFAEEARVRTKMASDANARSFGRAFGVEVKESGLLARSLWVIGKDGKVAYRELVADQGSEPNYDAMLAAVTAAAAK